MGCNAIGANDLGEYTIHTSGSPMIYHVCPARSTLVYEDGELTQELDVGRIMSAEVPVCGTGTTAVPHDYAGYDYYKCEVSGGMLATGAVGIAAIVFAVVFAVVGAWGVFNETARKRRARHAKIEQIHKATCGKMRKRGK